MTTLVDTKKTVPIDLDDSRWDKSLEGLREAAEREGSGGADYQTKLVELNLTQLRSYYMLVKSQASRGFKATLFVSICGFVLLGVGVALSFADKSNVAMLISFENQQS